jgi:hypothetical protein
MAFTYDETNLDTTTPAGRLNSVRLIIGDTDSSDPQLRDEEIQFALVSQNDSVYGAASKSAKYIAAKYSRLVDVDLDGQLSEKYSQLQKHYSDLSLYFEQEESSGSSGKVKLGVGAGGVSISEIWRVRNNPDRPQGFYNGEFDNWRASQDDTHYEL